MNVSNRNTNRSVVSWTLLFCFLLSWNPAVRARDEDKKPAVFEVVVPEEATLEVEGYQTRTTGETRRFQSPPLEPGYTYAYSIKATWRGYTLTRKISFRAEESTKVDLRQELQALADAPVVPPAPAESFGLLVPPAMTVLVGDSAAIPLRVKRFHASHPIRIAFDKLPEGIAIKNVTLAKEQTDTEAFVSVAKDAAPGTHKIEVLASGESCKDAACMKLVVVKPETKTVVAPSIIVPPPRETVTEIKPTSEPQKRRETPPERKQEVLPTSPVPKTAVGLRVVLPASVVLRRGHTGYLEVKVSTENGEALPAEPVVKLISPSEDKVTFAVWTTSDFKTGRTSYVAGFAVRSASATVPGTQEVKVQVSAGDSRVERVLPVIVKSPEP